MVLTGGIPGAGTPKGSLAAADATGLVAGVAGFAVVVAGFAAFAGGLAAVVTAGLAAGVAGVAGAWALAAMVLAANNRIRAECFMAWLTPGSA